MAEGRPLLAQQGTVAQERGGWPSSPTRFGIGADKQVIRLGLEGLQWPQCLGKVLDERDPLHVLQWWARGVLDQLHAAASAAGVHPTPFNITTGHLLNPCFKIRKLKAE